MVLASVKEAPRPNDEQSIFVICITLLLVHLTIAAMLQGPRCIDDGLAMALLRLPPSQYFLSEGWVERRGGTESSRETTHRGEFGGIVYPLVAGNPE